MPKFKQMTTYKVFGKFRKQISNAADKQETIGGNGMIAEIEQSKFGKRKHQRGHNVEGCWIVRE